MQLQEKATGFAHCDGSPTDSRFLLLTERCFSLTLLVSLSLLNLGSRQNKPPERANVSAWLIDARSHPSGCGRTLRRAASAFLRCCCWSVQVNGPPEHFWNILKAFDVFLWLGHVKWFFWQRMIWALDPQWLYLHTYISKLHRALMLQLSINIPVKLTT